VYAVGFDITRLNADLTRLNVLLVLTLPDE